MGAQKFLLHRCRNSRGPSYWINWRQFAHCGKTPPLRLPPPLIPPPAAHERVEVNLSAEHPIRLPQEQP